MTANPMTVEEARLALERAAETLYDLGAPLNAEESRKATTTFASQVEALQAQVREMREALADAREAVEWAEVESYSEFSDYERSQRYEAIKLRIDALIRPADQAVEQETNGG